MSKSRNLALLASVFALLGGTLVAEAASSGEYGFGRPATPAQVAAWDDDVNGLTGAGLPPGKGTVAAGQIVYESKCASCHGDFGEGAGRYPVLAGGSGSLTGDRVVPTVGSYWPYAPTLFDYIRRAMPFPSPGSLSNDEVYAVTAYVLNLNNLLPSGATLDAKSLAAVKMPNRDGFIDEHLVPDTHNVACMHDCKRAPVVITGDLAKSLNVTPPEAGDTDAEIAAMSAAGAGPAAADGSNAPVAFSTVASIVAQRCAVCHAAKPTQPGVSSPPLGIRLDTPAAIKANARAIEQQAVTSQAMPLGNVTHMTAQERALLGKWIDAGASIP